jgi:NAD(P)-dependent dehydrogenase (short-subunit alcohol dehydrogenase family)
MSDGAPQLATGIRGRTAVLSGASKLSGLGHAFSKGLAQEGANIVIADIEDGSEAAAILRNLGVKATFIKTDVADKAAVTALGEQVEKDFGGCDILVHCASPFPSHNLDEMDYDEWRLVVSVNLDGMFLLARAFVPGMKAKGWGRIIPISSTNYHAGMGGRTHYVSSKAGLIGFTRGLAREVGDFGITVNTLAPGLIRTIGAAESHVEDAVFAGRDPYAIIREEQCIRQTLVPDNLVGPLLFLASNQSAFVTGQQLLVDGGWKHVG